MTVNVPNPMRRPRVNGELLPATEPIGPWIATDAPNAHDSIVTIAVHNGGPPIPPEALPTIFDPLTRGSSLEMKKQRRPGSIGLGLYIAREVATAHGGTIGVTSTIDDGTTFTVHLPRTSSKA